MTKRLLTGPEAAEYLGLSPLTLREWSSRKINLPVVKIGRAVRYDLKDLDNFIAKNRTETER